MKASDSVKRGLKRVLNPGHKAALTEDYQVDANLLPTLWLLGKTGAGKSSLVQAVTGDEAATVGLGFKPCTLSSQSYDYPADKPLLRFLDTRGLGESDYDASADIDACRNASSAIVVVMKLDDPEQSSVINALQQVQQAKAKLAVIVVHTGRDLLASPHALHACHQHNQALVEKACRQTNIANVVVDLTETDQSELFELLAQQLPILTLSLHQARANDQESQSFAKLRNEVLWYAGIAGGSDILPVVGLVSVPSLQAKMIHSLAQQYGVKWGKREYAEFAGALGAGFGIHYSARLGVRQLAKLIPGYGQTIGAASAAALSFSSTYALGRVAGKYLYHKCRNEDVSREELKAVYMRALTASKEVANDVEHKH